MGSDCATSEIQVQRRARGCIRPETKPVIAALVLSVLAGCSSPPGFTALTSPAAAGSSLPNLSRTAGGLLMSWTEPADQGGHLLRFSSLRAGDGERWSAAQTIAHGTDWLINWADFPSLIELSDGGLLAHWLRKRAGGGYDVLLSDSRDGGATWSTPWTPHRDGSDTEHGFVSLVARGDGSAMAIWLDGRGFAGLEEVSAERHAAAALRYTLIDGTGAAPIPEANAIDLRACSCCQTSAAAVGDDVVVAYRDRSDTEIRDVSIARFEGGRWTAPFTVFDDGWHIDGCPVNGPSLAAEKNRVAVAWFTAAGEITQVKLAISEDGGRHFAAPVRIDDGHPQGRVDVALIADGSDRTVVAWQELRGTAVELRVATVRNGRRGKSKIVTSLPAGRASGFSQLAVVGNSVVLGWTGADTSGNPQVMSARLPVHSL